MTGKSTPAVKKPKNAKNPHLQARVRYLQEAFKYLSSANTTGDGTTTKAVERAAGSPSANSVGTAEIDHKHDQNVKSEQQQHGNPRYFANQARSVALKGQIRLTPEFKRTVCKCCDAPLILGQNSTRFIENSSKGGRKPWADVQVVLCQTCQTKKRFPLGAARQKSKAERQKAAQLARVKGKADDGSSSKLK